MIEPDETPHHDADGIDRRGFLECMSWAGTGLLWSVSAGIPAALTMAKAAAAAPATTPFSFVQISDSHLGFKRPANTDVVATLQAAIARVKALPVKPAFMIHTGDISHLSHADEFDAADQLIGEAGLPVFYVPGEHDVLDADKGKAYLDRYGKGSQGSGWYSFDHSGVHYIALVNVQNIGEGGLGRIGRDQLDWLAKDVSGLSSETPIVVFAHIPLWMVYPSWGWGTDDGGQALDVLKRFGSLTVLNGHIHQVMQKVEGNVSFHTARSTAFAQPAPGTAPTPGPMVVPAGTLRQHLGIAEVNFVRGSEPLAIVDTPLGA
ncbi:MAG: metallophosphoesterase [Ancalomicrobiaceae bacterium]|nr:metallophosphoesterase [Ancalomicrobiaceae bacterium]